MAIYKHEMRQSLSSVVLWTVILSVAIFLMLPVYIDMTSAENGNALQTMADSDVYDFIGTSAEMLVTPMGMFSFLTFFVLFACAIRGLNTGLVIMTKEYKQHSSDFLLTKPQRRSAVYWSKLLAALTGVVIIGMFYAVASWAALAQRPNPSTNINIYVLIVITVALIQVLFIPLGMLVGALIPSMRTTVFFSTGVIFVLFTIGSFSRKMGIDFLGYFSPLHFFNSASIIGQGNYEPRYMIMYGIWVVFFVASGLHVFATRDVKLVS